MPIFFACTTAGCAASVLGVKEGDSTLKDFFGLWSGFQHLIEKEVGRRTNTTSPFAAGMADEKS
jgi:hypothetical protein